ncbi:MAG: hypothetical protein ABIU96_05835 [Rhodanobacter sp.]
MSLLRFRLIGSRADVDHVIARVHGIDNIDHVEELGALEPATSDDSSSSQAAGDGAARTFVIEVEVPDEETADRVRVIAEGCAFARDAGIEFISDF